MASLRWVALALALAGGALACGGKPAWPAAQNPGSGCIDPCAAMTCPTGSRCAWNGQCQPRCEADLPPTNWKP